MTVHNRSRPKPTPAELEILNVLWQSGPSTVREVHSVLEASKNAGYTTVLKLMQIMADKGLLTREESGRAHIYSPVIRREEAQRRAVGDLIESMFGGSAAQLALRALAEQRASKKELAEIRNLLDEYEGKRR